MKMGIVNGCQLYRRGGGRTKQLEMPVAVLPKCQERTVSACEVGLQTVQKVQWLKKDFNWKEQACSCKGYASKSKVK
jgi:hypothetical protein